MKESVVRLRRRLEGREAGMLGSKKLACRLGALACLFLALGMLAAGPLAAEPDVPLEVVKVNVEKVLGILRDPAMQDEAAENQKKEAIRSISDDLFNWPLLSRGVLSRNWNKFTDDQKREFVSLFKTKLENLYINRILAYKDETIEYVSSKMLSDDKAEVQTHILSGGSPVDLTYRLGLVNGKWGVYDVKAEGVSMMENQRKQYKDFFLEDKTPEQLLELLREQAGEE